MVKKVAFPSTNENMYVIRDALAPSSRDNIYSVAGALDMPLMFLEQGAKVVAADNDKEQLRFCQQRKQYILDYLRPEPLEIPSKNSSFSKNIALRNTYMGDLGVDRVVESLPFLSLAYADMLSQIPTPHAFVQEGFLEHGFAHNLFNKVYLSNIFDHYFCDNETPEGLMIPQMDSFFKKFDPGTIFCLTERFLGFDFSQSAHVVEHKSLSERLSAQDNYWNIHLVEKK